MKKFPSIITTVIILACFICIAITNKYNNNLFTQEVSIPVLSNWVYNWDGEHEKRLVTIPADLSDKNKVGKNLYLSTYLPDLQFNEPVLLLRSSHQKIRVLINDQQIYEYGFSVNQSLSKTVGSSYHFVRLTSGYSNQKLTVVFNSDYTENGIINEVRIGNYSSHLIYLFKSNFLTFFIPVFLLIISFLMFFIFIPVVIFKQIKPDILYLAVFNTIISLWFMSESRIFQLLNSNPVQNYIFTFLMFYSFMIPLIIFIIRFYKPVNVKEMTAVLHTHILFFFTACILQFAGIMQMYELMRLYWCILFIDIIVFARAAAKMYTKANLESKVFWFGLLFPITLGIINAATMQLKIFENIVFIEFGMLLFTITTIISIIIMALSFNYNKASSDTLYMLAYKDILTGLKNRTSYEEEHEQLMTQGSNIGGTAVAIADLNNLKRLNDDIGHYAGDIGIKEVADCLNEAFSEYCDIYRYGGDEFIVISKNAESSKIISSIELFNALIEQTNKNNSLVKISVALGYAEFNINEDKDISDLINRADKEMYKVKQRMKAQASGFECKN